MHYRGIEDHPGVEVLHQAASQIAALRMVHALYEVNRCITLTRKHSTYVTCFPA